MFWHGTYTYKILSSQNILKPRRKSAIFKQRKNRPYLVGISWWEWLDSNQLRLKPTDLQSAPALQLRRTPELIRHMLLFVACHTKLWRSVVRAAGIEPAFQAWKACILAFVLCPQQIQSQMII